MKVIKGITVCKGYVAGKIFIASTGTRREKTLLQTLSKEFYGLNIENVKKIEILRKGLEQKKLKPGEIDSEIRKFQHAITASRKDLLAAKNKLKKSVSEKFSEIIDFQMLALKDTNIFDRVVDIIKSYRVSAYLAVSIVFNERIELLKQNKREKFKNRIYDLIDLYNRLVTRLKSTDLGKGGSQPGKESSLIMVTRNLFPTDLAEIDFSRVKGIVSAKGSIESHTSILIKSIKVPYLINLDEEISKLKNYQYAILDGYLGILIVDPDPATLDKYQKFTSPQLQAEKTRPGRHTDTKFSIMVNINSTGEAIEAKKIGVKGIGLFRTELSILNGDMGLTLEKQYLNYRKILALYGERPVTLRMLDLSGDKQALINLLYKESFRKEELRPKIEKILEIQLEALLKASTCGNLSISLPMVSKPEDIIAFKAMLQKVEKRLSQKKEAYREKIPVVAIIETPGAVFSLDYIIPNVDSLSIGTNDLLSLSYAVSRISTTAMENENFLYLPTLKMLQHIIRRVHRHDKKVTVCGEIASHPYYVPLLVGMGIDGFSIGLRNYNRVKNILDNLDPAECSNLVKKAFSASTKEEIEKLLKLK
ncbi:MAG: putative PEP-binding protein [Actinomycetota bacterium]